MKTSCKTCGINLDERTKGCNTCRMRFHSRKQLLKPKWKAYMNDYINNPVNKQKNKEYRKRTLECKTVYLGAGVCPKCNREGYEYQVFEKNKNTGYMRKHFFFNHHSPVGVARSCYLPENYSKDFPS